METKYAAKKKAEYLSFLVEGSDISARIKSQASPEETRILRHLIYEKTGFWISTRGATKTYDAQKIWIQWFNKSLGIEHSCQAIRIPRSLVESLPLDQNHIDYVKKLFCVSLLLNKPEKWQNLRTLIMKIYEAWNGSTFFQNDEFLQKQEIWIEMWNAIQSPKEVKKK
jgi:hypothetical protein